MKLEKLLLLFIVLLPNIVSASNVFNGKEVYLKECVACHGSRGAGELPGIPNFAESNILFKMNSELINAVKDGKGIMPGYNGLLTTDEIRDVIAYIRTFR